MKALLALVVEAALSWLYTKVMTLVTAYIARQRRKSEIEEQNRKAREQTEAAQTKEERDAAAENIRRRF